MKTRRGWGLVARFLGRLVVLIRIHLRSFRRRRFQYRCCMIRRLLWNFLWKKKKLFKLMKKESDLQSVRKESYSLLLLMLVVPAGSSLMRILSRHNSNNNRNSQNNNKITLRMDNNNNNNNSDETNVLYIFRIYYNQKFYQ